MLVKTDRSPLLAPTMREPQKKPPSKAEKEPKVEEKTVPRAPLRQPNSSLP